jgi:TetR/AcrR family transcriptional repressor of nem operon
MIGLQPDPPLGELDSIAALGAWASSYTERPDVREGGCSFGSLAAEVSRGDLDARDEVAAGFERRRDLFERGLTVIRGRSELRPSADPCQLAYALMAAFQGGLLLAQSAHDLTSLRGALDAAIDRAASFAPCPRQPASGRRPEPGLAS